MRREQRAFTPLTALGSPTCVVFDCDGTLVDTEPVAWAALRDTLQDCGYDPTEADERACLGRSEADCYRHLKSRAALPDSSVFWRRCRKRMLDSLSSDGLSPYADIPPLLEGLSERGLRLAVASSSSGERLRAVLAIAGLAHHFEVVASGDEVTRGKPAPDVFLLAAARLAQPPVACLAVEDSPVGLAAALAAGMPVVRIDSRATRRQGGGHAVAPVSLLELLRERPPAA